MAGRSIYFAVAELNEPEAEPFMVLRIDTSRRRGNGAEAVVESLHWSQEVATKVADRLNRGLENGTVIL